MEQLIIILTLFIVGYFSGRHFEKNHFKSIIEREKALIKLPIIASEWAEEIDASHEGTLFSSGVVIGSDYFKTTVSGIRSLFGGRLKDYESMLDRGRREAILRVK